MKEKLLTLELQKEKYGVCRLNKTYEIPEWALSSSFYSITGTSDELSIVCMQDSIPTDIKCEREWSVLKVLGPLDFSQVGILASISAVLAEKSISIFAVSTYDTDYILVKSRDVEKAIESLTAASYEVIYSL